MHTLERPRALLDVTIWRSGLEQECRVVARADALHAFPQVAGTLDEGDGNRHAMLVGAPPWATKADNSFATEPNSAKNSQSEMDMARMHNPPHPGEVLREFLPDATTIEDVARRLGVSRVQLSRVLNGRSAISADMAIRIGLLTGTTPESWLVGQAKRDLWQASQNPPPTVEPFRRAA